MSCFSGRGKRTAWDTWNAYGNVTPAFCALVARPTPQSIQEWLAPLELFVILLCDHTSSQNYVNEARKQLFTQRGRAIGGLPSTQAALIQPIKKAAYQAGHCWAQMEIAAAELPSPSEWGWNKKAEGGWEVCWTTNQKPHKLVGNSYVVAARKAAEDIASVGRLLCSALHFTFAMDFAQTNHCNNNMNSDSI